MNPPTTLRRGLAVLATAAGLAVAAGMLAGCGPDAEADTASSHGSSTTDDHHHDESTDNGDGVFDITATEYAFTTEHASVPAGSVTVRLTNTGAEAQQVHIARAPEGVDAESFIQTFESEGEGATFEALGWVGGVNGVEPGNAATAVVDLEPGDYLLVCYFPAPDGSSHVMKGMVAPLHVTEAEAAPSASTPTSATETVTLSDYRIELPEGFRGQGEVAFRNEGAENHEVVIVRLREGKTLADAAAWQEHQEGPAPFTFANGIATIAPGMMATSTLDLEPGDYIATCFVQGPDGTPHIELGMLAVFTVA